jgi:hypothetical protein
MDKPIDKGQKMGDAAASVEKKARQLVYDARYEVKNELQGKKVAPAVVERMVLQRIAKSTAIPAVKARAKEMVTKKPAVREEYFTATEDTASGSIANALFKVFVEGIKEEEAPITLVYEQEMKNSKYHIRVTDPKTGRTYTRMADREKITQLRAKGLKVEMSEYKDSTETRKEQEKGAKKRAKRDYDGDGKVESSSKEHAGAVHNAIQRAKGGTPDGRDTRKEDYVWTEGATGTTSVEGQNARKIDIMKSNEQNAVKVFPEIKEEAVSKSQQKFMAMVCQVKKGKMDAPSPEVAKAAKGMSEKDACDYAETKHKGLPEKVSEEATCPKCGKSPCECDTRANQTYRDLLKAKFRSMGKNPLVMMGDEENLEKSYNDMMTASFIKPNKETGKLEPVSLYSEQQKAPHGWKPYGGRPKPGDNSEGSTEVDATRKRIDAIRQSIIVKKA